MKVYELFGMAEGESTDPADIVAMLDYEVTVQKENDELSGGMNQMNSKVESIDHEKEEILITAF